MSTPDNSPAKLAARQLSQLGASKGGRVRAARLTREERSASARAAVESRWAKVGKDPLPRATHPGTLRVGDIEFDCAVLEDGTRVISETKFMASMGMYRSGALSVRRKSDLKSNIPLFLAHKNIRPFALQHLGDDDYSLVRYISSSGSIANGIKAELIPIVCEVWLDAERAGVLGPHQRKVARLADTLLRGLARVGIVALVDEATGYQDVRAKDALAKILEEFVSKELRKYLKTFPIDYYKQIYRLNGWEWSLNAKMGQHSPIIGKWTNDIVYDRIAPGLREELHRVTPRDKKGRLKHKLFQRLSDQVGHPKLLEHLAAVVALMKGSNDIDQFREMLDRALPAYGKTMPLPMNTTRVRVPKRIE